MEHVLRQSQVEHHSAGLLSDLVHLQRDRSVPGSHLIDNVSGGFTSVISLNSKVKADHSSNAESWNSCSDFYLNVVKMCSFSLW